MYGGTGRRERKVGQRAEIEGDRPRAGATHSEELQSSDNYQSVQ